MAQYNFFLRRGQNNSIKYQSIGVIFLIGFLIEYFLPSDVIFLWLIVATSRSTPPTLELGPPSIPSPPSLDELYNNFVSKSTAHAPLVTRRDAAASQGIPWPIGIGMVLFNTCRVSCTLCVVHVQVFVHMSFLGGFLYPPRPFAH